MATPNKQQAAAIKYLEGPSLIVAGPGSGKTFVIVEKVSKLVKSGAEQQSILCMTFTQKAAEEMKQRLKKQDLPDVVVSTFHAFAKELLEENSLESGIGKPARLFLKTSKMIWCMNNTDKFEFDDEVFEIGGRQSQIKIYGKMLQAISSFKQVMRTPNDLQEYLNKKIATLDPDAEHDMEEVKMCKKLNELNKVYKAYQIHCKENDLIDFDDMVGMAVNMLEKDPVILRRCNDRFKHILVDEFQDNNYSQMQLVKLMGKERQITVVGDEDQSIMRFQGAYARIFDDFKSTYSKFKLFALDRNYRSTKNITNLATQLLDQANQGEKNLYSNEEKGEKIHVISSPTDAGEVEFVVEKIRSLVNTHVRGRDDEPNRKLKYKDFAILTRRRDEGEKFTKSLRSFGIPATFVMESSIVTSPVIRDLMAYLRVASLPATSGAEIYRILRGNGIDDKNIRVITNAAHHKKMKSEKKDKDTERDHVLDTLLEHKKYRLAQRNEIASIVKRLDYMIRLASRATVADLVHHVIFDISGLYKMLINTDKPEDRRGVLLLNKFYEIAQEFQEMNPDKDLADFIAEVELIRDLDVDIEDWVTEDAVNVLTMHKSKGREFPVVFIADLIDERFPLKWSEIEFPIPAEMMRGEEMHTKEMHIREERRLLYVAMTRAMNLLYMMRPRRRSQTIREKMPSQFLVELDYENNPLIKPVEFAESDEFIMEAEDEIGREKARLQGEIIRATSQLHMSEAIHKMVDLSRVMYYEQHGTFKGFVPKSAIKIAASKLDRSSIISKKRQKLINRETLTLSASSIKTYMDCPLQFKYQKVLRVPQKPSLALNLGSIIHSAIDDVSKSGSLNKKKCLNILSERWKSSAHQHTVGDSSAWERAKDMLDSYLAREKTTENKLVGTEIPFEVNIAGIPYTGRIDRLEKNQNGGLEVVDFKSGSSMISKNMVPLNPQLNIYAKAVEKLKGKLPVKASLFYLEKNKPVEYNVTSESVSEALAIIIDAARDILKEEFEPTPSYSACRLCSYTGICDYKAPGV